MAGIDVQRLPIRLDGFLKLALFDEDLPQVNERIGVLCVYLERLP